jgi:hypothetical protein
MASADATIFGADDWHRVGAGLSVPGLGVLVFGLLLTDACGI